MSFKHAPKVTADVCLYIYIHWNLCTLLIHAGHDEHTNPSHLSPQQRFTSLCRVKTLLLRLHWPLEMYYRVFTHLLWSIIINKLRHINEWSTFHVIIHKFVCFRNCEVLWLDDSLNKYNTVLDDKLLRIKLCATHINAKLLKILHISKCYLCSNCKASVNHATLPSCVCCSLRAQTYSYKIHQHWSFVLWRRKWDSGCDGN